jgi:hypothetical protein
VVTDFASAGFRNVRIRMNLDKPTLNTTFMAKLKNQVNLCLNNGISPILAYQGYLLEESTQTHEQNKIHLAEWWENMTDAFQGYSYNLSFNILIEISGRYKDDYTNMNDFYAEVYRRVRNKDANRILIFPPVHLSDPDNLQYLVIPGGATEKYVAAEWHFYAAGPNPDTSSKKYWINGSTAEERSGVLEPIQTAVSWSQSKGYSTWVGAWMAGNYNKGNNYNIVEQVRFGSFMAQSLEDANIPWSINADNKFYNFENHTWFLTSDTAGIAVRDAILSPRSACLYSGINYAGDCIKLTEGTYSRTDLNGRGFVGVQSLMVPFGYYAILTSEAMGMIVQNIYYSTTSTIPVSQITSVQVVKS